MPSALRISEATSLASHAMAFLSSDPEKRHSVKEHSETLCSSEAHLAKVMQRLAKQGLVESVRGPGGGYVLARSMDEISVKDVLVSVGENINPARDLVGTGDMKSDTVEFILTKTYFENLGLIMQEYLTTTSVGDLIRKARGAQDMPKGAAAAMELGGFQIPASAQANAGKSRDLS